MRPCEGLPGGAILKPPGLAAVIILASPQTVSAHGALPGAAGFAFGAAHTVTVPIEVLVFLGCGLLAGRASSGHVLRALSLLALVFMAGMLIGQFGLGPGREYQALLVIAALAMIVSAATVTLPSGLSLGFLAGIGVLAGIVNAPGPAPAWHVAATMAGSLFGAMVLVSLVALLVARLARVQRFWIGIALRIVSAWLAAIAGIALALVMRTTA